MPKSQYDILSGAVTRQRLAQAFEAWEQGFRADPTKFLTAEETAALGVSEVSVSRAWYFFELLDVLSRDPAQPSAADCLVEAAKKLASKNPGGFTMQQILQEFDWRHDKYAFDFVTSSLVAAGYSLARDPYAQHLTWAMRGKLGGAEQ